MMPAAKKSRVSQLAFDLSSHKPDIAACRVVDLGSQDVYVTMKVLAAHMSAERQNVVVFAPSSDVRRVLGGEGQEIPGSKEVAWVNARSFAPFLCGDFEDAVALDFGIGEVVKRGRPYTMRCLRRAQGGSAQVSLTSGAVPQICVDMRGAPQALFWSPSRRVRSWTLVAFTTGFAVDDLEALPIVSDPKGETSYDVEIQPRLCAALQDALMASCEGKKPFYDGQFEVDGVQVPFHCAVACGYSEVLAAAFTGQWKEGEGEKRSFTLHDSTLQEATCLVEFLYTGRLDVERVPALLALGRYLQIAPLLRACARVAKREVLSPACDRRALLEAFMGAKDEPVLEGVFAGLLETCSSAQSDARNLIMELLL
jgi:hypothetical protein